MTDIQRNALDRRRFLSTSGLGLYSLCVFGEGTSEGASKSPQQIRDGFDRIAPSDATETARSFAGERHMTTVDLECDVFIAGGGPAGVCAALAAAREGAKVVLVQDRSRLGGNSSSEVKMHIVGANNHGGRPGWREGGIIEELRLDDAANNPQRCWELWDLLLYDKIVSEPNCTLLLDTTLFSVEKSGPALTRAFARCDRTEHIYRITSKLFADCTGDSRLALEAGATIRWGHEARSEFNEPLAWDEPSRKTQGSSILFTARDYGKPMPFKAPAWARKIDHKQLYGRPISSTSWEYGYWWIEWGGVTDTVRDNERIRFELLSIVTGVWDYIKNSGKYPSSSTWAMDWIGMMPGKRESRRIEGDHILTQHDLMGLNGDLEDAVAIGGWGMDEHPPGGFDDHELKPYVSTKLSQPYNIPLRSLYSKDVPNLLMAGRNASCSHTAFTSTRVMATCAVMGQAMGTAAALCIRYGLSPRELYADKSRLRELQQTLLRNDQTIIGRRNEDEADLALKAKVTASGETKTGPAANILDGIVRDLPGEASHRWIAPLDAGEAWIELAWNAPQTVRRVQLTFNTGFERELTLSASESTNKRITRGPQPETVRDYVVQLRTTDGKLIEAARVTDNHQRLRRHEFDPTNVSAVRVTVLATNGVPEASLFEVRCYG